MLRCTMRRVFAFLRSISAILLALLVFQSCNSLNPACGSARPAPTITSLSVTTITFAEVQQGFVLTVNGSHFVSSTVGMINGTALTTLVTSPTQLQVTLTTPSGTSGDLGCTSGGTSSALSLTIT